MALFNNERPEERRDIWIALAVVLVFGGLVGYFLWPTAKTETEQMAAESSEITQNERSANEARSSNDITETNDDKKENLSQDNSESIDNQLVNRNTTRAADNKSKEQSEVRLAENGLVEEQSSITTSDPKIEKEPEESKPADTISADVEKNISSRKNEKSERKQTAPVSSSTPVQRIKKSSYTPYNGPVPSTISNAPSGCIMVLGAFERKENTNRKLRYFAEKGWQNLYRGTHNGKEYIGMPVNCSVEHDKQFITDFRYQYVADAWFFNLP